MITKVLVSTTIALGAAVGLAAPALADPSTDQINPFGAICSGSKDCAPTGETGKAPEQMPPDQMMREIQDGFSGLQAIKAQQ